MNYTPAPHKTQHWALTKPSATGKRGMVVSQVRSAAEAGVAILDAGGNAIDAAVATALALAAVEPWNSGLGGIGFALVHRAGQKRADVVDFGPVAPRGLNPSRLQTDRPNDARTCSPGPRSRATPTSTARCRSPSRPRPPAMRSMHQTWGKLPLAEVIAPAIALAKRGLPQDWYTTLKVASSASVLRNYAESARIYLPDGLPPVAALSGQARLLPPRQPARDAGAAGHAGLRDYYEGDIAATHRRRHQGAGRRAVGRGSARLPGPDPAGDRIHLARPHAATGRRADRRADHDAGAGPDGGGAVTAPRPTPPGIVAFARAMKTAYAERLDGPGRRRPAGRGDLHHASDGLRPGGNDGGDDHHAAVLDGQPGGAAASGVLLNNGVMWFDPRPNQPNSIAGGKRPLTNMSPIILKDGDRPWLAAGASGGRRILAAVTQMMSFIADFGMTRGRGGASSAHRRVRSRRRLRRSAAAGRRARRACGRRPDRGGGARRDADQLRLPERDPARRGRHGDRDQRRGLALVGGGRASLTPEPARGRAPGRE